MSSGFESIAHGRRARISALRRLWGAGFKFAIALALSVQLAACIPILVSPATESQSQEAEITPADHRLIIWSPAIYSNLLHRLNEEIEKEIVGAEKVDSKEFWRALFPEGKDKITLQQLLDPVLLSRVDSLCVDYIIFVVAETGDLESLDEGLLYQYSLSSQYRVGIVDPKDCRSFKTVHATASGEGWHLWLPLPYVLLFYFGRDIPEPSDLEEEVVQELAFRIGEEIAPPVEGSRVRFLLLDAQAQEERKEVLSPSKAEQEDQESDNQIDGTRR